MSTHSILETAQAPQSQAGISSTALGVGLVVVALYAIGASVAVHQALTYSAHFDLKREALTELNGQPALEVEVTLKALPTSLWGDKSPKLGINSVSGPPYVWNDLTWEQLELPEPAAGATYQIRAPITGELAERLRLDGAVKWSLRWGEARLRQHELSK